MLLTSVFFKTRQKICHFNWIRSFRGSGYRQKVKATYNTSLMQHDVTQMFSTRTTPQRRFLFDFHWITSDSNRVTQELGDNIITILNWDMMCIADSYFLFFVICMNSLELRTIKLWYSRRIHSWTPCQGKRVPQYVFKLYFPEVKTTTWIFSFNVWKPTACDHSQCTLKLVLPKRIG